MRIEESKMKKNTAIDKIKGTKCKNCAGIMKLDTPSGSLVCPYCGYSVKIAYYDTEVIEEGVLRKQTNRDNQDFKKRVIICKSCGAQSFIHSSKIISVCEFCGSDQLIQKNEDALEPDGIIPFKIDRADVEQYIRKWLKKKKFCLSSFKKKSSISNIYGVYIPYWTFDAKTRSTYNTIDGDKIYGEGIDDYLVLATTDYDIMELKKIEPFDTKENKEFKSQYLVDYDSRYYNVGLRDAWAAGVDEIKNTLVKNIVKDEWRRNKNIISKKTVGRLRTEFKQVTYKQLLFPVWFIDVTHKDKNYQFLLNGQTGKIAGKVPIDVIKCIGALLLGIILICLLCMLFAKGFSLLTFLSDDILDIIFIIIVVIFFIVLMVAQMFR